eukprot:6260477-Prorocentrum_lima.AAC.1
MHALTGSGAPCVHCRPCMVSYQGSTAYRDRGKGLVWDTTTGLLVQPPAEFREASMGFHVGASALPGVLESERWSLIGQAMSVLQVGYVLLASVAVRQSGGASPANPPQQVEARAAKLKRPAATGTSSAWGWRLRQVWTIILMTALLTSTVLAGEPTLHR